MQVDQRTGNARHHVLIAGTGRAGTSFLVSYLTTAGRDTGFDSSNTTAHLDPHALAELKWTMRLCVARYAAYVRGQRAISQTTGRVILPVSPFRKIEDRRRINEN